MRARRRGTSTPARRCASLSSWRSCRTWSSDSSLPSRRPEMGRKVKKIRRAQRRPALAILSRKKTLYSTRRLIEAAKARSFRTRVIDVLRCNLALESGNPRLYHKGKEVRGIGVALPRIGASVTAVGLSVARQLEAMGVPLINGASAIARSRDKVAALVEQVGGLPAILKLIQGTQGVGVMIAHSVAEVESILGTLWDLGQEILLQEFVSESRGRDIRALVVGDRVVGAMRREARRGEFRSNLHRGGFGTAVELPADYAEAAVRAARVVGLDVAGVDLLESSEGPTVVELNSSPGFEGLERATGLDIAGEIVAFAAQVADGARRGMAL